MNRDLRQIFVELSNGKLTRQQALEQIRAAKQQSASGMLLAAPAWQSAALPAAGQDYAEEHLLSLQAVADESLAERYTRQALECFETIQAILRGKPQGRVLLQVAADDELAAGLSALLRTASQENPQFVGQLVIGGREQLEAEKRRGTDPLVRYQNGTRQVPRWNEITIDQDKPQLSFRDDGIYLITGGLGAIGLLFAREILSKTGHARVILTGRSELDAAKQARLNALTTQPGRVSYRRVDLADAAAVEGLIAGIEDRHGELTGILHCAGMIEDDFIIRKTAADFARVLAPKVLGTFNLDRATRDLDVDFFVLFSSFAGAMGNVGQADYAAANGFMDALAAQRNAQGRRTRSINWPLWQDGGMAVDAASHERLQRATGMQPMQTATGIEAFHRTLALPHAQVLVGEGDVAEMRRRVILSREDGEGASAVAAEQVLRFAQDDTERFAQDDTGLVAKTEEYLRRELAVVLKMPAGAIDPQAALEQYGIDSILAMRLTGQLEQTFGALPKTLFFEYQTIAALSGYFAEAYASKLAALFEAPVERKQVEVVAPKETKRAPRRTTSRRRSQETATENDPIAIIGLSGRYPEAVDLAAYWNNLRDGKDCIVEVPKDRWDWREYFSEDRTEAGHHYSKWGGFIAGVDEFDPLFFNISPKEAKFIDPQERLFLQHAWMAVEDAGYTRASLQIAHDDDLAGQVGVYVGVMYSEYQLFGAESSVNGHRLGIAGSAASIANRVSYALNLHGPSVTLDTMCSSSLTAIHFACQDLKLGRTNLAIAGGVNVTIHPNKYLVLSGGQFISSDGACQSFGEGGDGYIPGEGVGAVVLKRLSEAKRDGDHVYGIIRGSALNHGGKTNGYTVPNPQAQATAISRALVDANVDARHVSYIEAHGTGTKLGDPIEIAALNKAFRKSTSDTGFCLIGSAKSNIGHCESAAGIAGLTKVLLQMQHKQIVPSLHSAKLNPHIDFESSPFTVNQTLREWEQPVVEGRTLPRIAGISSFGAGGSNAHLIIEEYAAPTRVILSRANGEGPSAIVLSARTPEQLQQKARDLAEFVRASNIDLPAVAYTLQTGREAMDERLAFVVTSAEELVKKLEAFIAGDETGLHRDQVKRNRETLSSLTVDADKWIAERNLAGLLDLWVKGLDLDWNKLHGQDKPQRVSLPAYPFARERYWIDVEPAAPKATTASVLHPLLHANTSDLTQQSYRSLFNNETLATGALLEMARAAVADATRGTADVDLRDVVFAAPVPVSEVSIALTVVDGAIEFEIYASDGDEELVLCQGRTARENEPAEAQVVAPEVIELDVIEPNVVEPIETVDVPRPTLVRREIAFTASSPTPKKQRGTVALAAPGASLSATPAAAGRARITLSNAAAPSESAPVSSPVRLFDCGNGVFSIDIPASREKDVISHTIAALERVQQEPSLKVLLLAGVEHLFLTAARDERKLFARLLSFPYPVIAVQPGDVIGAGFLAAALCDFLVCSEEALYGYGHATVAEAALLAERFGAPLANDFLFLSPASTGRELRAKGWTCPFVPFDEVETRAEALATTLAAKSQDALRLLKQHLTRNLTPLVDALTRVERSAVKVDGEVLVIRDLVALPATAKHKAIVLALDPAEPVTEYDIRKLQSLDVPVVAALTGNASGNAWLIALRCDATVHATTGRYSASDLSSPLAAAVFAGRFGNAVARELLLGGTRTGIELRQRAGTTIVAEADQVVTEALRIAQSATKLPAVAVENAVSESNESDVPVTAGPIRLNSNVVTVTAHADGVVVVKLEDRQARNMFSEAFVHGVSEAFAHIAATPGYRVVVLTGYDNYFAAGGTRESLLAIQGGKAKFTDVDVFRLPIECRLPVVAAVQGHALGAGWAMGMYADVAILSDESRYVSPYMNYGFTPGAGATWILADKIGQDLSRESLFTAEYYAGSELRQRGLRLPILPRAEVVDAAMRVAREIAKSSRSRLIALKEQLTRSMRAALEDTYRREVAMHEQTFVGHSETLSKIQVNFHDEVEARPVVVATETPVATSPVADALPAVMATLRTLLANELQMRESDIDDQAQFVDLGLDSISGVSWIRRINEKYKTSIEATKVYGHPTLVQLGRHVKDEAEKQGTLPVVAVAAPAPAPVVVAAPVSVAVTNIKPAAAKLTSRRNRNASRLTVVTETKAPRATEPVAIIGIAGQFPQAKNVDEFWRNIAEGKNCITRVARERFDLDAFYQPGDAVPGKTNCQWLGALEEYDRFDPLFFNISPTEAESMDPQQRLFLQACWHGIEDAGYDARNLSGSKTGVFVGCAGGDYLQASRQHELSAQGFTGGAMSILAARISYFLNLQGPCISIDTACSSSLVAIANACDSLNSGSSDLALAGGVYVMGGPDMHIRTAQAGMLSPDGKCYTFDQRANGFVPGEGVGVVVLKRLSDAQRDGDVVYGVVQGWGVNQDGRTNGITAPNPESQTRLEQDVYDRFAIDPEQIQLIEAHGTGTKLGDPIEVEGLKQSFSKYTKKSGYCAIGSVKSNIGHTLTAAGIAGVLKLVLALKNKQLPPTIHFEKLNEHIDLAGSPFYVNARLEEWKQNGAARKAAISSFGFSGTNAHLVIGEHEGVILSREGSSRAVIVPLSARTTAQLEQKAADLLAFIRRNPSVNLTDLAYTLQVGRQPMDERLGFVAASIEGLASKLESYVAGDRNIEDGHQGQVKRGKTTLAVLGQDDDLTRTVVDKCVAEQKLGKLLELWIHGVELDWTRLYGQSKPRRISLPVYPFAKDRYWIAAPRTADIATATTAVLHPLLHANTSDLRHVRFTSKFAEAQPAGACLEMARAAIERVLPEPAAFELREVVFGEPLGGEVHITLSSTDEQTIDFEIHGADVVHCQGRAAVPAGVAAPALDTDGATEIALTLSGEYGFHPNILEQLGGAPVSLQSLRVLGPCTSAMTARVHGGDVDVRDANGNVCVQLRGLALRANAGVVTAAPVWQAANAGAKVEFAERHVIQPEQTGNLAERYTAAAQACFETVQSILQSKPQGKVLVQLALNDDAEELLLAGLSGLLKTAALENPQVVGQVVIGAPQNEQSTDAVVRYRNGAREVLRWQEVPAAPGAPVAFKEDGVYLITGGRGAIGTLFVNEILAKTTAARVIVTGRSASRGIESPRVTYRQVDLSDLAQVTSLVADVQAELGRLDGILHCAGMTADNFIVKKSAAEFASVLAPKVTGTYNLDQATRELELDFFVLFSSIASAVGNVGQADYAAANGFMDRFAAHRNALVAAGERRGRTRSINWPLWQDGGMSIDEAARELVMRTIGAQPLQTATGLAAFHRALALAHDQLLVVEGVESKIRNFLFATRKTVSVARKSAVSINQLQHELKAILAAVLGIDAAAIDADQPFAEFGLDSFLGAEVVVRINKKFGTELSHARLFDYSTVNELARFLANEIPAQQTEEVVEAEPVSSTSAVPVLARSIRSSARLTIRKADPSDDRIAIIGMSGRYPQAPDLDTYWQNLVEGRNAVTEVPSWRWDVNRYFDTDRTRKDKTYSKWLGAIDDVDRFDPLFFRISPQEAEHIDPQHRLFLQESYKAFEDAGYSTLTLSNKKCGVYLGISTNEYLGMVSRAGFLSAPVTSNSYAIAAARIAYHLNLKGPAISVDTACSSSLVGIHLACQALQNGEIDMALAGGVSLWLTPDSYVSMSKAGMFSPDGQCKTFDDSANGIVNGEGVGAVVLKRLRDAERDGDVIHGVILGSGINQDGRTNGITAPSVNSQIELERSIYAKHDIDPDTISYIETHGTGTKLGDPIELEALSTVFGERTSRRNFCALGSVKSNIGHTTSAAGVAGLQKVLLSMRHRTLVPTLHVKKENARFDFSKSPFYVSRETAPWNVAPGTARRAAVSSFGFSGTNAHIVVEEYRAPVSQPAPRAQQGPFLVPLSARGTDPLRQRSRDLLAFLRTAQQPIDLASVAWTLQIGREAMEERLAFVVHTADELIAKLEAHLRGDRGIDGVHQGRVEPGSDGMILIGRDDDMQEAIEKWIARRKLSTLADSWVRGLSFDWNKLYDGARPRRASLPTYPFAKERCWIEAPAFDDLREEHLASAADIESIEDLLGRIADDDLDSAHAVQALKHLV